LGLGLALAPLFLTWAQETVFFEYLQRPSIVSLPFVKTVQAALEGGGSHLAFKDMPALAGMLHWKT